MACKQWKNDWVAHLYEELEPAEACEVEGHLEECAECRDTMESLSASRRFLRESVPAVPPAPSVVVIQPARPAWGTAWAFAAGGACTAVVFALGLFAAPLLTGTPGTPGIQTDSQPAQAEEAWLDPVMPTQDSQAEIIQALSRDLRRFEDRLARMEERPERDPLTPDRLNTELDLIENRFKQERARDMNYVLEALTASEIRTGTWLGQTQDALDMLALRQDPRFRER